MATNVFIKYSDLTIYQEWQLTIFKENLLLATTDISGHYTSL